MRFRLIESVDDKYLELAKEPDKNKEALQKMVEAEARKSGYTIKAYHGTKDKFTVFQHNKVNQYDSGYLGTGFYFTDKEENANDYADWKHGSDGKRTLCVYLKINNPLVVEDKYPNLIAVQKALDTQITSFDNYLIRPDKRISDAVTAESKKQGHDGVQRYSEFYGDTTYVVYDSFQIKLADTVTYDDNNNIISLSKRFSNSDDIRESKNNFTMTEDYNSYYNKIWYHGGNIYQNQRIFLTDEYGFAMRMGKVSNFKLSNSAKILRIDAYDAPYDSIDINNLPDELKHCFNVRNIDIEDIANKAFSLGYDALIAENILEGESGEMSITDLIVRDSSLIVNK